MDNNCPAESSNLKRHGSFSSDDEDLNDTESKKRLKLDNETSDIAMQEGGANKSCTTNSSKQYQFSQNDKAIKQEAPDCIEDSKPKINADSASVNEQARSRR